MYIHQRRFYTPPASLFYFIPALSPISHFAFLVFSMAVPLLPAPYPTLIHLLALFSQAPLPLHGLSHPPPPACSPYTHFAFLTLFMAVPLLPAPPPTIIYSLPLFYQAPYPCLIHPIPLPLPAPSLTPHFRFFGPFMDAFLCISICYSIYICTYMIYGIE